MHSCNLFLVLQVNKLQSWSQGCPVERKTLPDKTSEPRSKTGTPRDHQDQQAADRRPDDHNHQDRAEDDAGRDDDAPGPGSGQESDGSGEIDQSFYSDNYEKDSPDSVMEETEERENLEDEREDDDENVEDPEREEEEESEAAGHGEEGEERGGRQTGEEKGEEGGESERNDVRVPGGVPPVGSASWREGARSPEVGGSRGASVTEQQTFSSGRSLASFPILVSEEVMQQTAEALSRTGLVSSVDTDPQETVRKMALVKAE